MPRSSSIFAASSMGCPTTGRARLCWRRSRRPWARPPPIPDHPKGADILVNLIAIFASVFLAELGDKTQLATLLFASDSRQSPALVFVAAAAALCLSTAIACLLGSMAGHYLTHMPLKLIAGLGFIAIGAWTLYGHFRGASAMQVDGVPY